MILRIALRNLRRHRWRSGLTAGGIALAVAMLVWTRAWIDSFESLMIRGATAVEIGQVQLRTEQYFDRASLYRSFTLRPELLDAVRGTPGVSAAAPRIQAYGLVGNEQRSQVARVVGVDPAADAATALLDDGIDEGAWLGNDAAPIPGPREAVIGFRLAEQLGIGVGDELVVFLQAADGSLGNDLLQVIGTVRTANSAVDRSSVFVHIDDLAYIAALEGRVHEIAVAIDDLDDVDAVAAGIVAALPPPIPDEDPPIVKTWRQTMRELSTMLDTNQMSIWVTYLLLYAVAALGLVNTQRMGALERRREFGVLIALGMRPGLIGAMIIVETVALTALGAFLGLLVGGGVSFFHQEYGLDMGMFTDKGGGFTFMGIAFSERLYFDVTPWGLVEPALVVLGVAFFCGLWPAITAMRIDAVRAIAGRT